MDNAGGALMPGMYSEVDLAVPRKDPPLIIPADTLVVRGDGPQVAVVDSGGVVHYKLIHLGRDLGASIEVLDGLEEGQLLAVNPGDQRCAKVSGFSPRPLAEKAAPKR